MIYVRIYNKIYNNSFVNIYLILMRQLIFFNQTKIKEKSQSNSNHCNSTNIIQIIIYSYNTAMI